MTKTQREYYDLISSYGCEIVSSRCNKHLVVKCRTQTGRVFTMTLPTSPSDWRSSKNLAAQISKSIAA